MNGKVSTIDPTDETLVPPYGRVTMAGNESISSARQPRWHPDRIEQILNRLFKHHEGLSYEDRLERIRAEIMTLEVSEADRLELLRRLE